jgi:hypothetical protein
MSETKTILQKSPALPSTDPEDLVIPPNKSLKTYFVGCALIGRLAGQEHAYFNTAFWKLGEDAYEPGELIFEKFTEEHPPVVHKFNLRLGL